VPRKVRKIFTQSGHVTSLSHFIDKVYSVNRSLILPSPPFFWAHNVFLPNTVYETVALLVVPREKSDTVQV